MDLSKVYDSLLHDLSIAKLEVYGLGNGSALGNKELQLVPLSKWSKIRRGIPQGSILWLNLFNIFINDISMIIEQSAICNFVDDNSLYSW